MIGTLIWLWLTVLVVLLAGGTLATMGRNMRAGNAQHRRERAEREARERAEWVAFGERH